MSEVDGQGPIGYLWHYTSGYSVRPRNLEQRYWTELVLNEQMPSDLTLVQFRFIPKSGAGHFGYIEHVKSGNVVGTNTTNHTPYPVNGAGLFLHTKKDASAIFGFQGNEELDPDIPKTIFRPTCDLGETIMWRPKGGCPFPRNGTPLVVNRNYTVGSQFYFGDQDKNPIYPYPTPSLSGKWRLLCAFVSPKIKHEHTETYKVGRSVIKHSSWCISTEYAKSLYSSDPVLSGAVSETTQCAWEEERELSRKMTVNPGDSVYVWQFTFIVSQYNEEISFRTDLLGDSNSKDEKPKLTV